jgi:hypothetical protein
MKKVLIAIILIASWYCTVENATVDASTGSTAQKFVSVELTVNSHGANGSQFILKGLQTPAKPSYACTKTSTVSDASGNGTSVHFAVVDLNGVDKVKITVKGTAVGKLTVINDTFVDQSGNPVAGKISVRKLN